MILGDPVSDEEFEVYLLDLLQTIAPGDAFILGAADSVMAEAKLERIERVIEMVEECGVYPIEKRGCPLNQWMESDLLL